MLAWEFEGKRYDIGDIPGWINSQFELALKHPVYGPQLRAHLRDLNERENLF
jgi:UTP-glucose-1-phosphate uridylyltransferase